MSSRTSRESSLYDRIGRLRWKAALLALILVLGHQWIEHAYLFFLPRWTHFWTQVIFYGLVGPILAWWALTSLRRQVAETQAAERSLRQSRDELASVNERLEFLISVERRLAEVREEENLLRLILTLPQEVLPTLGCSLIRFDDLGRPLAPLHSGELAPEESSSWTAHLASSQSAQPCEGCQARAADTSAPCPILSETPDRIQTRRVYCLPLERSGRELAVLNIYLGQSDRPSVEEGTLLEVMATGMSMALESHMLRSKELDALTHFQEFHHKESLENQLSAVLASALGALEAQGGAVFSPASGSVELRRLALVGEQGPLTAELLAGFAASVKETKTPLHARNFELKDSAGQAEVALVAAPLRREATWLGSLLFWSFSASPMSQRQRKVIEVIGSQASLLIDNHRLYREVEYRAGSAERARLAREIHDGLAQTLGYLKLRAIQIGRWLEGGRTEQVGPGIEEIRRLLDDAYVDAREAIDGLRIHPAGGGIQDWLEQTCQEFRHLSEMEIEASTVPPVELRPETQAQILRIIQEALGNVRKHSRATRASIDWIVDRDWLVVTVTDDGIGFDPDDVPPVSRHGLRIMQERAELLGADFQVRSKSGEGTRVEVRLPLKELRHSGSYD